MRDSNQPHNLMILIGRKTTIITANPIESGKHARNSIIRWRRTELHTSTLWTHVDAHNPISLEEKSDNEEISGQRLSTTRKRLSRVLFRSAIDKP